MQEFNFLKLDYSYEDGLRFKHIVNYGSMVDISLNISKQEAISLIEYLRALLIGEAENDFKSFGNYSIMLNVVNINTFKIDVMENRGQKCKPLGCIMYSGYMGNISLLDGLRKAKKEILEY